MNDRKSIGVFVANSHTDHPGKIIKGIYQYFSKQDVDVHFFLGTEVGGFHDKGDDQSDSLNFDYQYLSLYDYAKFEKFDMILIGLGTISTFQRMLDKQMFLEKFDPTPILVLEDVTKPKTGFNLIIDNYGGMKQIVEHLIHEHEKKDICYISGPEENYDSQQRLKAYLDAMIENGLLVTDEMIEYGDYSEQVDEQVNNLFANNEHVEAVVCANDDMTRSVYRYCEKHDLVVGKDVLVTGFDNVSWAWAAQPGLTTVKQKSTTMGRIAAELAMRYLNGEEVQPEAIGTSIITRHSCGCTSARNRATEKDETNVYSALSESRRIWNHAVAGPLHLREMIQTTDNEHAFFSTIARQLIRMGIRSSFMFLLKEPMLNEKGKPWKLDDELYVVFRQYGETFHIHGVEEAKTVKVGEGLIPKRQFRDDGPHRYFSFLLFDGNRQYGILTVEIEPENVSVFYLYASQIGIAFHFRELSFQAEEDKEKLQEQNALLNYSASSDALTGLLNRRGVLEQMQRLNLINEGKQACIFIGDLDHLKQINDTFGHAEGDFAIKAASELLRRVIGGSEPLGRIGGDEFLGMFLIEDGENPQEIIKKKISDAKLSAELFNTVSGKPYYLGVSIGAHAFVCSPDVVVSNLIKDADRQLYIAKKSRRESVCREVPVTEDREDFYIDDTLLYDTEDDD